MQPMKPLLATLKHFRVRSRCVRLIASDRSTSLHAPVALGATHLTEMDLEEVLRPHISPRRRTAHIGVVLALVLITAGPLLQSIEPFQQGTATPLPSPAPMPPTVVIASNVSFGTLIVNGHVLNDPPPVVTHFVHKGANVVTLSAPPFGRHTCRFWYTNSPLPSSYQLSSDTPCSGSSPAYRTFEVRGISVVPNLILNIELSGTDLPSDLATRAFAEALRAIAAVRPQTVVLAGQYYATGQDAQGHINSQPATVPMHAQLLFAPEGCGPSQFCPIPVDPRLAFAPGLRVWSVGLFLTARWRFTLPTGPAILSPTVPLVLPLRLFLADGGPGGWSALILPPSVITVLGLATPSPVDQLTAAVCQLGVNLLAGLMLAQGLKGYSLNTPSDRGVEGCAIQVLQGSSTSSIPWGRFLWRFGVLLAVDTGARRLGPWLPIAPSAEVVAVEI